MQAIILAAGMGRRLGEKTRETVSAGPAARHHCGGL